MNIYSSEDIIDSHCILCTVVNRMTTLKGNFAICVAGPSSSGKSTFVVDLLNNLHRMSDTQFEKIIWILGDPNAKPNNLKIPVEYMIGVPDEFVNTNKKPQLYILDDSMFETQNRSVANLFTRGCHHQNISVIFITQNIFHQGKYARDISLNFSHIVVMNNPRDRSQFQYLSRQLWPENPKALLNIYKEITQEPFSYMYIDLNQRTHNLLRFRTDIFNPNYSTVFVGNIPSQINGEDVQHEDCGEGVAHVARFTRSQL